MGAGWVSAIYSGLCQRVNRMRGVTANRNRDLGVAGAKGPASKMHLVIKTECVHHRATQLPDG